MQRDYAKPDVPMKIQKKLVAALTMLLILWGSLSALDVKADFLSEEVSYPEEIQTLPNTVSSSDLDLVRDLAVAERKKAVLSDGEISVLSDREISEPSDREVSAPAFSAYVEYSSQGYVVQGVFTEFSSDISSVRPLYSLDGEGWNLCAPELEWDLHWMNIEGEAALKKLQTQICLYAGNEPLSSYLAGELDCFYLKLCLTREDGSTCETQTAIIERGDSRPLPQDLNASAAFDRSVLVGQRSCYYGRYQLTISADATVEDVTALLPDTLPVEIQFQRDNLFVTGGVVDCPVTWKPFILSQLTAGDTVTIQDATEEIVIPGGTLVNTPLGIFQLNEPLRIDQFPFTDDVMLVLNVVADDEDPAGVLRCNRDGLEMAFDLKPTGATAIHAYTFSDDASGWVKLSGVSFLEAVNSYPSAASSGYTLVMGDDSELLQGYLAAKAAGEEPTPFYVGLKIEGGVYDGRQLVLVWPDTYHEIPSLPNVGGAGGNEGNAGADNKGDSTAEGQRPNLSQDSTEVPGGEGQPEQSQESTEAPGEGQPGQSQESTEAPGEGQPEQSQKSTEAPGEEQPEQSQESTEAPREGQPEQSEEPLKVSEEQLEQSQDSVEDPERITEQSQIPVEADHIEKTKEEHLSLAQYANQGDESGGQRPALSQNSVDGPKEGQPAPQDSTDTGITSVPISSRSLSIPLLLVMVIAISYIFTIIVTGRGIL